MSARSARPDVLEVIQLKYTSVIFLALLCVGTGCDDSGSPAAELAPPIMAEPSSGPNVLPEPATSTQPAEPVPACDPQRVIDLNRAAMPTNDGGFLIKTEHGVRNDFIGECGGTGKEQVFKFTAGAAGLWIFSVEADDLYLDTILYARSSCDDEETEIACNDDIVPNEILQSRLNLRLAKGATVFVYADSYAGEGGTFDLRVRTVPEQQNGESCDVTERKNVCPEDSFCRVDQNSPGAEGICSANEPAVVTRVRAYRNGDALQLGIDGTDSGGDVTRANLQLFGPPQMRCVGTNDDGSQRITNTSCTGSSNCQSGENCESVDVRIQLNSQGADTYILQPLEPVFGRTSFTFKWASDVLENFPQTTRVRVRFEDSRENQGEWSAVTAIENVPQGTADNCDQARVLNVCPSGQACMDPDDDGTHGCVEVNAPVLDKVKVFYDAETKLMAVEASGTDADKDIRGVQVSYLDGQGSVVGSITYKFDFIERENTAYTGYASFEVESTSPPVAANIKSYDEERILSNELSADMFIEAVTANEGEICDQRGARAPCAEGLFCYPPRKVHRMSVDDPEQSAQAGMSSN